MGKSNRKRIRKSGKQPYKQSQAARNEFDDQKADRRLEWLAIGLLLAFGIYQSVVYYQHQPVPSSDFPAFVGTAESLLDFKLPGSFKRVPMLGLLQIGLSKFCPGPHPVLTAGWVLNGILHTLSILLFYRVGKHFLGKNAFFFAVLAGINPWVLQMATDPIAETTLIFFILLTFDFMLRRSRWCYLFAMIASITRYEGAGLIAAAFFVDMILCANKKERIRALILAMVASIPVVLWIVLWKVYRPDSKHYTGHFINTKTRVGLEYWKLLWQTTFGPLLQIPAWVGAVFGTLKVTTQQQAEKIQQSAKTLTVAIQWFTGAGFVWAIIYSIIKKRWKFFALLAFWVFYVGIHSIRHATLDRYTIPAIWMTLLIVFYGLQSMWQFIQEKCPVPRPIVMGMQILITVAALIWIFRLVPVLPETVSRSKNSTTLVYVSIGVVLLYLIFRWWAYNKTGILKSITCLSVCGLLLVSNQFRVVRVVGNGGKDGEFKMLAEWYRENAEPDDKMLTTMPQVVTIFIPEYKTNIRHIAGPAKTPQEFVQRCYKQDVKYVVWDSRIGLSSRDSYYKKWNLQKITILAQPRDIGPFEFVKRIELNRRRYLHIFKLKPLPEKTHLGEGSP